MVALSSLVGGGAAESTCYSTGVIKPDKPYHTCLCSTTNVCIPVCSRTGYAGYCVLSISPINTTCFWATGMPENGLESRSTVYAIQADGSLTNLLGCWTYTHCVLNGVTYSTDFINPISDGCCGLFLVPYEHNSSCWGLGCQHPYYVAGYNASSPAITYCQCGTVHAASTVDQVAIATSGTGCTIIIARECACCANAIRARTHGPNLNLCSTCCLLTGGCNIESSTNYTLARNESGHNFVFKHSGGVCPDQGSNVGYRSLAFRNDTAILVCGCDAGYYGSQFGDTVSDTSHPVGPEWSAEYGPAFFGDVTRTWFGRIKYGCACCNYVCVSKSHATEFFYKKALMPLSSQSSCNTLRIYAQGACGCGANMSTGSQFIAFENNSSMNVLRDQNICDNTGWKPWVSQANYTMTNRRGPGPFFQFVETETPFGKGVRCAVYSTNNECYDGADGNYYQTAVVGEYMVETYVKCCCCTTVGECFTFKVYKINDLSA